MTDKQTFNANDCDRHNLFQTKLTELQIRYRELIFESGGDGKRILVVLLIVSKLF